MAETPAKKPEPKKDAAKKKDSNPFRVWFPIALAAVLLYLFFDGRFDLAENKWEDRMHLQRGMRPADKRISLVAIDDKSIGEIGTYPWPRSTYKPLIDNLVKLGARVIAFDVLFIDANKEYPAENKALIDATRKAGNVVHAVEIDPDSAINVWSFSKPFDALLAVTKHMGCVNMPLIDTDGAVRRAPLMLSEARTNFNVDVLLSTGNVRFATLGVAALAAFERKAPEDYVKEFGPYVRLNIAGQTERDEDSGAIINNEHVLVHRIDYAFPRISAIDVINGNLSPEEKKRLKGSIVMVGSTAIGAFDHYPTPFTPQAPGMEVHANLIDNLLQRNYLVDISDWLSILLIIVATTVPIGLIRLSPLWGSLISVGLSFGILSMSYGLFLHNLRIASVAPVVGLGGSYVVLMVQKILHEQKEKRWIKNTFGQYLSPKVVEALVLDPDKLKLGGEKRDMSVFFLDIAHFTTISEKMDPEALTHFLNKYLTALTNVILKNDGVVDKYIGDCIMAFWNAPVDQPRHRELSCLSAIECQEAIVRLNKELLSDEMPEQPAIRIGLNAGYCVVGNMGSETRFSYTVIGDVVNLASRLEGANKFFGSKIMASEDVFPPEIHDKFEARELGRVRVVGKAIPIRVYELWGKAGSLPANEKAALEDFKQGQILFLQRKFEEAGALFAKAQAVMPEDKVFQIYNSAAQDYALLPPGDDWDGVFNLTSK